MPDAEGTCPTHRYARLLEVDDDEAAAEQALLRKLQHDRQNTLAGFAAAGVLGLLVLGLLLGLDTGLMLVPLLSYLLYLPPVALLGRAWQRRSQQTLRRPVWLWAAVVAAGWFALVLAAFTIDDVQGLPSFSTDLQLVLVWLSVFVPVSVWGSALLATLGAWSTRSAPAETTAQPEAAKKGVREPPKQRQ